MAAPTNYYVDPAIAGNSGTGTIGDPFGDLQYALNTIVRDATNGDQINIKAGTAEILAASLTLATYGTPTFAIPLILRGYTAVANDGGIAEINCNGVTMFTLAYVMQLINLEMHSFGNNNGVSLGVSSVVSKCKIHKGLSAPSAKNLIVLASHARVVGCYIYDAGTNGYAASVDIGVYFSLNYDYNCPKGVYTAQGLVVGNIIVDCTTSGIEGAARSVIIGNTIYSSSAATGKGIAVTDSNIIINNIIVGYSGAGGVGILAANTAIKGFNAFYNNTTPESLTDVFNDLGNDVALAASPFTNPAGGDFSLSTAVVGAIDGAFPGTWYGPAATIDHADIGAVQNGAGAGGGGAVSISPMRGGL